MKVYLCIKVGMQDDGDYVMVQTESGFADKTKAEAFFMDKVKNWKEVVDNIVYNCTRAIHEVDVIM